MRRRGVTDPHEAEELTQEVFVRVLARIDDDPSATPIVRAYLVRAAEHLVTDRRRRRAVHDRVSTAAPPALSDPDLAAPSAEDQVLGRLEGVDALGALAQLPELQRVVLRLRLFEELSAEEVGARIGKRAATVRQLQHRALLALRRIIETQQERP